ncbi:hypothetical protein [Pedobacter zeae]|uniref:AAA domain-containing protein n=1 Tax=Pedobacter zeae TaxID=1737356 RepID=A0A7W6P567_9SPHI|nr:hypothetical protein [Pedobacter zeae]MBB4106641.1 hypothetical protein [Pedobacter zeae]GGH02898.1 hypothetical protein GCM10007422_17610 [Pedobacter zeae]
MKALGLDQYYKKKFKKLKIALEWARHLGDLPLAFIMVIMGYRGNGKTEYCVRLAKMLCEFGKVAWLSYEQGHGPDLQKAMFRNDMIDVKGIFYAIDPKANKPEDKTYLDDLFDYLDKPSSAQFIFIDSVDYTGWKWADYKALKERYPRKAFIFIGHALPSGAPKKAITDDIAFDGHYAIIVKKYMALVDKTRMGGGESFVIWEEMARKFHPQFFQAS